MWYTKSKLNIPWIESQQIGNIAGAFKTANSFLFRLKSEQFCESSGFPRSKRQSNWDIASNLCSLLRKSETINYLYLTFVYQPLNR